MLTSQLGILNQFKLWKREIAMRNGHMIYKVKNLDKTVKEWRDKGFVAEYGRKK